MENKTSSSSNNNNETSLNIDEFFDDICSLRDKMHMKNNKLLEFREKLKLDAEFHGISPNDTDVKDLEIISLDELFKGQSYYIDLLELFIYEIYGKEQLNDEMDIH